MDAIDAAAAADEERCASCDATVAAHLTRRCAWCERRVCAGCLRTYGHYQLVCQDCHLGDW